MSASLVGSEMCIRDRQSSGQKAECRHGPGPPEAPGEASGGALGSRTRPVSYTHLTLPTICSV
eukprot:13730827-Alexandrium_andersonii.AAC.1